MALRRLFPLILALAVSLQALPVRGETPAAPAWGLRDLMRSLSAVPSATAHFVEHRYLHVLKKPLVVSGTLAYTAPGRLQKDTLAPKPEHVVIDGDTLTVEREGKTETLQLADYPQIGALIEGIRGTLAGDLATLDRVYTVHLDGSAEAWQLRLEPRDPKTQAIVQAIVISGSRARIERIDTQESEGDRSEMTIIADAP